MGTLQDYIKSPEVKPIYRGRYSANGYFITWANQLLEELQERGFLPAQLKETGAVITNSIWITPPSDIVTLEKVYNPEDERQALRVSEVNGKYKLMDIECDQGTARFDSCSVFNTAESTTTSMFAIIGDPLVSKVIDQYKNYLFRVVTGNAAGFTIPIFRNDATDSIKTKLYYSYELDTALTVGPDSDVTKFDLIPPQYYVMIKYRGTITPITDADDEMPIPDTIEARLVPTWLRWCCEREAMETSKETIYWEKAKEDILFSIQAKLSARLNPAKGRRLVGMETTGSMRKQHPPYSTYLS